MPSECRSSSTRWLPAAARGSEEKSLARVLAALLAGREDPLELELAEALLEAGRVLVGVLEAADRRVEARELGLRAVADRLEVRQGVDQLAAPEDRHEQILVGGAGRHVLA